MLCKAAMAATERLPLGGAPYGQKVMLCANDWQAALVPVYLKQEQRNGNWLDARSSLIVHNMVFQGRFPNDANAGARLHIAPDLLSSMTLSQTLKIGDQKGGEGNPSMSVLNFLLGGIKAADKVLTVSPGYAREVSTCPIKGAEMERTLQAVGIRGILNGVEDVVRPDNAVLGLTETYDADSLEKKRQVKAAMQASLGFAVDPDIPMFLFMGRLDGQKGVDIMFESVRQALNAGLNAQFITMGSGLETLEEIATELEDKFPSNFRAVLSFKGAEKYRTFAAADFALMPSRYEPCGLVQMEGMRFGTLPIVSPTGGLADTVKNMQTGLVMEKEVDQSKITTEDVAMLMNSITRACKLFREPNYREMQRSAMKSSAEFSWTNSAIQYIDAFRSMW
jgi:granule-bound starch synthase